MVMLVKLLAAFFFAYYFVNVANIPMLIKRVFKLNPQKRIKPFDCVVCLSVWVALILFFLPSTYSECLLVCFGAGFLSTRIK